MSGEMLVAPARLEREHALAQLRDMVRIRRLEEKCVELYGKGSIRGFLHLYIGEEAVAVGVNPALRPDEAVVATYREHGHALLRGVSARAIMAEMFGKLEGCSRGRGGSMHLFSAPTRFYGGSAIVGGGVPIAVGLALADKMQGRNRVTACFLGDGAVAEGVCHESFNLAALWKLPVLFLCENNLYAMGTALAHEHAQTDLRAKAASHTIVSEAVDGMDVVAVEEAATRAAAAVRAGEGPRFLELRTYRFRSHSAFDPELYRSKTEVEEWKKRDPIATFAARLRGEHFIEDGDLERIVADADREIADAVDFSERGAWEPLEDLLKDVTTPRRPS